MTGINAHAAEARKIIGGQIKVHRIALGAPQKWTEENNMRLIDANSADVEKIPSYYGDSCRSEDIQEWLDEQPTVDTVPVVHAHWEDGGGDWDNILGEYYLRNTYVCSSCRVEERRNTSYCPNCGAKMEV